MTLPATAVRSPQSAQYALTAADIIELRIRMARAGAAFVIDGEPRTVAPFIVWGGGEYALHAAGACLARSERAEVICALLRNERIEPGYTRALLDAADPCDLLALPPDRRAIEREKRAREAANHRARLREHQEAEAARAARNPRTPRPGDLDYLPPLDTKNLSLDDLL